MTFGSIGGSIGGTSSLNQLWAAQAASNCNAPAQSAPDTSATTGSSGTNALTGSTTASLDSQTLGALMDLTQQDPSSDPSSGQTGQPQGVHHHHHHHHHGGDPQGQSGDSSTASSSSSTTTGTSSTTDAMGVASTASADESGDSGDTTEASLTQALLSA